MHTQPKFLVHFLILRPPRGFFHGHDMVDEVLAVHNAWPNQRSLLNSIPRDKMLPEPPPNTRFFTCTLLTWSLHPLLVILRRKCISTVSVKPNSLKTAHYLLLQFTGKKSVSWNRWSGRHRERINYACQSFSNELIRSKITCFPVNG